MIETISIPYNLKIRKYYKGQFSLLKFKYRTYDSGKIKLPM